MCDINQMIKGTKDIRDEIRKDTPLKTEMTKPDHSAAAFRVKLADKMVILPLLFDGTQPEVVK